MVTFNWEEGDANEKVKNFKRKKALSWVVIELTEACNLNCIWCYANSGNVIKGRYMPLEKLESILKMLADAGVRQITYSGGEPTIYPYIKEAVKLAKDLGFVVHMNTNGFLFTKSFAKELRKLGLSQIQTNIDSIDPKRHNYIRGREGSFERAVKALRNADRAGITAVSQTVLTRLNENEIFSIFVLSRSLGAKRCRVWDMTLSEGAGKSIAKIAPTDYIKTLEKLYEFALERGLKSIESGEPLFPLGRNLSVPVLGGFCISYFGAYTTISVEGNAFYCAAYRKPMYNIFEGKGIGIDELHRQKLLNFISKNLRIPDTCHGCEFSRICRGGCIVRREANKGVDGACSLGKTHLEKPILSTL